MCRTRTDPEEVAASMVGSIQSRHEAAFILHRVAEEGESGHFPVDVTCEELGRALRRTCSNSNEANPLAEIVRGYVDAEVEFWKRC